MKRVSSLVERKRAESALAEIRLLCTLGLPGTVVVPAVIQAAHRVIQFDLSAFVWFDAQFTPTNAYAESDVMNTGQEHYLRHYLNQRERDTMLGTADLMWSERKLENSENLQKNFRNSEIYDEIYRPPGIDRYMRIAMPSQQGLHTGFTWLRGPGQNPFSAEDERRSVQIAGHIEHALAIARSRPAAESSAAKIGDDGLVILDGSGRVQMMSARARYLLNLAVHPQMTPGHFLKLEASPFASIFTRLARQLADPNPDAAPPAWAHVNDWGRFVLRASRLEAADGAAPAHIGVALSLHLPIQVHAIENLREHPLSSRERETCVLITSGCTYAEIAAKMNISTRTAIDYAQTAFRKLGVGNREALLRKLQSDI